MKKGRLAPALSCILSMLLPAVIRDIVRLAPTLLILFVALRVRWIQRRFLDAGAIAPERAVSLETLGVRNFGLAYRILTRRGIIAPSGGGYYLDLDARERWRRRRRIVVPIFAGLVLLLALITFLRGTG